MHRRVILAGTFLVACTKPGPSGVSATGDESTSASTSTTGTSDGSSTSETGEGQLPPVPTLVSPADDASDLPLELELCWELVEDPDGDPLRYRVFIDDTVVEEGVLGGEPGHAGPCVGPLLFAYERTYTWQVEAFESADPTRSSGKSEAWSFSTIGDGLSELVFEDGFDGDLGWELSGSAASGTWLRGDPIPATEQGLTTQPGSCAGGSACYFTGQNPNGVPDDADVSGGETMLTSPPFDLGGAAAATIELVRFFYKSGAEPEPGLLVELLVPNDAAPEGYDAYALEQLDSATSLLAENVWTPREYAACGLPMQAGSRLRITAADSGVGILEAAIDSVAVRAFDDPGFCSSGLAGRCDPQQGDSCPVELACCSQGAVNVGVYRCTEPVAGLDYDNPTASPDEPGNGTIGCDAPDLIVDPSVIEPIFTEILVTDATCELLEGCVDATGSRRVMLFTVSTPNIGSADLALGVPANHPELFHYSDCHHHYHFDEYARYELRDGGDNVVARGHKQAFCMLDTLSWAWPFELGKFDCSNQGISRGFFDTYDSGLPCQWVDITDLAPGDYTLRIALNQPRKDHALPVLNERDYGNNVVAVPVVIP